MTMSERAARSLGPRRTLASFRRALLLNLYHTRGAALQSASRHDNYMSLSYTVRNYLIERWRRTTEAHFRENPKFVYYLSAEYLLGRQLPQNLLYTGTESLARRTLAPEDVRLRDLIELDREPGLGNGGLGRLAACFLDSMATLDIPAVGYGLRYEFGIFRQQIEDGWQVEQPDDWLTHGNPWEFSKPGDMFEVGFYGSTERQDDGDGGFHVCWSPGETVLGEPYHTLVPGYGTGTVNLLRLWRARATQGFDFRLFDTGDYARAVERKVMTENITKVLYPNDSTPQGKELRLKQQYFFVACSLRDIIRRFHLCNQDWSVFPDKVAIQLNDTHPVVAIPELMRLLMDENDLPWRRAWDITSRIFSYTCHTLMPEALERWPVSLFEKLLPRHMEIVREINERFLADVRTKLEPDAVERVSLLSSGPEPHVRMANLATVGSTCVNGVAELQSELMRKHTFRDFARLWPERFQNKTNGVTPRRFLRLANPRLSQLIDSKIGKGWMRDLEQLSGLEPWAEEVRFRRRWRQVKRRNKNELADIVEREIGLSVDPSSMFDVMVKRLHEYKRQLLKVLHIITLYQRFQRDSDYPLPSRTFVFAAKAAPGYEMAKLIIKLIHSVADAVNNDPGVDRRLRVAFLPNFNVTLAQWIYPAADLSEQISLAGKEASGTGNMKFALNGALTVGTLDGANVEIRERVGEENFFLFGLTAEQAIEIRANGYEPRAYYEENADLRAAMDAIGDGSFSGGDAELFRPVVDSLLNHDEYLLLADYAAYIEVQDRIDEAFRDTEAWTRMSILNAARTGYFSSDRTIREYCRDIWKVTPVPVPE